MCFFFNLFFQCIIRGNTNCKSCARPLLEHGHVYIVYDLIYEPGLIVSAAAAYWEHISRLYLPIHDV